MPLTLPEFVTRWKASLLTERAAAQSHFLDLCEVLRHPHPAASDPSGESFAFEKHVSATRGGKGFSDVWKRGFFAWEYKGKHKDLKAAYLQLNDYREDLENPPLLVVCDQELFEVHTNFTGTRPHVYRFGLSDLLYPKPAPNSALAPLEVLKAVFYDPDSLRPEREAARVTEAAAAAFAKLSDNLKTRGVDPQQGAHFLMRLLFCLFADSIGLLPEHLFRQVIHLDRAKPINFTRKLRQLFAAMSTQGNNFGAHDIAWFNGGLFGDDKVFELTFADVGVLRVAAELDWSNVEPAIFGTLFERSLDPGKRSQLGAHYTSPADILLIVEPVVIAPLAARWQAVKAEALALAEAAENAGSAAVPGKKGNGGNGSGSAARSKLRAEMEAKLHGWLEELSKVRILDPACGSGNFLYLALRRMLDLWREVVVFSAEHGLPTVQTFQVHPSQLYGLETNVYAHELASVVVWIGYLQWLKENGMGWPQEPILRTLNNIQHRDAILDHDAEGKAVEPEWPEAEFIIGNPPFLGGKRLRTELGDHYVDELFALYEGRVPHEADLVAYWFEKARSQIATEPIRRAGLLATQGIRGGASRKVLERILESGGIFMAWSDREWTLDGAAVRVSIVGFDSGFQAARTLDGNDTDFINPNLTSETNTTSAQTLSENRRICYQGTIKVGDFDLSPENAEKMLCAPVNPNGRRNSEVIVPWINASDVTGRRRNLYVVDFGTDMSKEDAELYELPFEHLLTRVKPVRDKVSRKNHRENWWLHAEARPGMRLALSGLKRFIVTPRVAKHRFFVWENAGTLPDSRLFVFARQDDYFLGILQSRTHEVWSLATCSWHGDGDNGGRPTYNGASCFETFPFPWPPGQEPKDSPLVEAIAAAARDLVVKRDAWLNPPDASPEEWKKRTLTNLYNARPSWLAAAHARLDGAVFAAYGWPSTLTDAELLDRLLALNHQRAASQ